MAQYLHPREISVLVSVQGNHHTQNSLTNLYDSKHINIISFIICLVEVNLMRVSDLVVEPQGIFTIIKYNCKT